MSYTIDLYAAPVDSWLQQQSGSASCRRVFGRDGFSAQFPFLLKWSVARRYAQFRQLALQMKTKSLISALPPRQGSKVSEAVTANRKVYFARFLRRLLPKQGDARIKDFLAGGMVSPSAWCVAWSLHRFAPYVQCLTLYASFLELCAGGH